MATWLAWPSVLGEFQAEPLACAEQGIERFQTPRYQPADLPIDLNAVFRRVIVDQLGAYSSVALSISGGLDSAAVLVHLIEACAKRGVELHLLTAELTGDDGSTNIHHIERLLDGLGIAAPIHRVGAHTEHDGSGRLYYWSPVGPRLDSSPQVNDALVDNAIRLGAEAIFTGAGSDELTGVVRYLLWWLLARGKLDQFRSYWRDSISVSHHAAILEALAPLMAALPRRWRAIAYYAITQDPPIELTAPELVATPYRDHVRDWSRTWMVQRLCFQTSTHRSWAAMEAWESLDPVCPPITADDPIPFLHPFMTHDFVRAVMQTPLEARYSPCHENAYWRQKSIVLDLIGEKSWGYLPIKKQIFADWMRENQSATPESVRLLLDLGIVNERALSTTDNTMLLHRVAALESWALEAMQRGYTFSD